MAGKAEDLAVAIQSALSSFGSFVSDSGWKGREREAVSLFAFGFLSAQCRPGSCLHDLTQIGIEVAVPQLPGSRRKTLVCKDLVIWPEPRMNVWDRNGGATNLPWAIVEWKCNHPGQVGADREWLTEFSLRSEDFVGSAVDLMIGKPESSMTVTKIERGVSDSLRIL